MNYLKFEQYRISCHRGSYDIRTQNTENKLGLRLVYKEEVCQIAGLLFKLPHKLFSFIPTSLIRYNVKSPIKKKIKPLLRPK